MNASMLMLLADTVEDPKLTGSERWITGLTTFGIGMVAIFVILTMLVGIIYLMKAILARPKKSANSEVPAESVVPAVEEGLSEEVVAAISAAITVCLTEEAEGSVPAPFRIRSIRKRI